MDSVTIRVENEVKSQAAAILNGLGLDLSSATRAFYHQVILHKGLPFSVEFPQEQLSPEAEARFTEAEQHLKDGKPGYTSPSALFEALGI
jgi:DNA-damage-inducible protein J